MLLLGRWLLLFDVDIFSVCKLPNKMVDLRFMNPVVLLPPLPRMMRML